MYYGIEQLIESHGMWLQDEPTGRRLNLKHASIGDQDFTGKMLDSASFLWCNLHGASFMDAYLERADFFESDLRDANFSYAHMLGAEFDCAIMYHANLEGSDLRAASLEFADLRGANLANCDLRAANLHCCDLRGANLEGARMEGAYMDGALIDEPEPDPALPIDPSPKGRAKDLTGMRFGRWTVLGRAEKRVKGDPAYWVCRCDCGAVRVVNGGNLKKGLSKSCGCGIRAKLNIKEGE